MGFRTTIERLPPYPSLLLLGVPLLIVECSKLLALIFAAEGHWIGGVTFLVGAYGAGALGTERLFVIVKPKLLTLPWFARLWGYVSRFYEGVRDRLRNLMSG